MKPQVKVRSQRESCKPSFAGAAILTKKCPEDFAACNDIFSEKTVHSPNYQSAKNGDPEKRKAMSFNSPHNLGGIKHFVFGGKQAHR